MNRQQFEAWEGRIATRAHQLWRDAGNPEGSLAPYYEQARELIAIEENPDSGTLDPAEAAEPIVEEASLMRNLGEFPTLTDQGDEQTYPDMADHDDIHLSDNDASDNGGVLPMEDEPEEERADISVADADITTDTTDADNEDPAEDEDLNDDGLADQPPFVANDRRRQSE